MGAIARGEYNKCTLSLDAMPGPDRPLRQNDQYRGVRSGNMVKILRTRTIAAKGSDCVNDRAALNQSANLPDHASPLMGVDQFKRKCPPDRV